MERTENRLSDGVNKRPSNSNSNSNSNVLYLDYNVKKSNRSCNNSQNGHGHGDDHGNRNGHGLKKDGLELHAKIECLERRLCNIESMLWDNRDKYTKSLDIVANRELDINEIVTETRKILAENRELYSSAFRDLFEKEEKLESMLDDLREFWIVQKRETSTQLGETQKILAENRRIYSHALAELRDAEVANGRSLERIQENTPIFLGPASALNPLLSHINRQRIPNQKPTKHP